MNNKNKSNSNKSNKIKKNKIPKVINKSQGIILNKKKWSPFEHSVFRKWKLIPLQYSKKIVVGLSGGVDSVALLLSLKRIQSRMAPFELSAFYIHHGYDPSNELQNKYRDKAQFFCEGLCEKLEVPFEVSEKPLSILKSEEEYRNFRLNQFSKFKDLTIALAHHLDDSLETRLIRLIRGTAMEGLQSLKEWNPDFKFWRPFLDISKNDLMTYVKDQNEQCIDDPSNDSNDYFRNWLRNYWLKELEAFRPGSLKSLSRSLETIAEQWANLKADQKIPLIPLELKTENAEGSVSVSMNRSQFLSLTVDNQKQIIISAINQLGIQKFTQGQIKEIIKQLDNSQRVFRFKSCNAYWFVDAQQIKIVSS